MRLVEWDDGGWTRLSLVRDDDSDEVAPLGIPHDPPDLNKLLWGEIAGEYRALLLDRGVDEADAETLCAEIEAADGFVRDLHNELIRRRLITWDDVQRAQTGVSATVRTVVREYAPDGAAPAAARLAKGVVGNAIVALYRHRERE